jgi:hypothetical protein
MCDSYNVVFELIRCIMSNENASPIQNEPVPKRPLMRAEVVRAAIEGNKDALIRLLGLQPEACSNDHEVIND